MPPVKALPSTPSIAPRSTSACRWDRSSCADVVGLDVLLHVGEIVTRELQQEPPPFMETRAALVQRGKLGRKSGQGFYRWRDGKIVREPERSRHARPRI